MYLEGILGVLTASAAIIAVKTATTEYWAWRNRRDLRAQRVLEALAGPTQLQGYAELLATGKVYNPYPTAGSTAGAAGGILYSWFPWPI